MNKALFLSLTLAVVALAGCTDAPAAGTFTATQPAADFSAGVLTVESTAASNNYPGAQEQQCQADAVFGNDPTGQFPFACEGASSTVSFTEGGATLPDTGSGTYSLVLIGADEAEFALGDMENHGNGHYDYPATTFDGQDFSSATEVQVRFGEAVVATTPGTGGTLALAEGMDALEATVTYDGAEMTIELNEGAPMGPFVAWLVDIPEEEDDDGNVVTGEAVHSVQILLGGGSTTYTLSADEGVVGDYEEFHIHVGNSKINVVKATIPATVEE